MLDQEDLDRLQEAKENPNKFVISTPEDRQKLGAITVICLILNRTIGGFMRSATACEPYCNELKTFFNLGSGIFILPATVLRGTDSIGISLLIWTFAGIVSIAAILVWLELSLSIPRYELDGNEVSVPRSGGEKNYASTTSRSWRLQPDFCQLEYIYKRPKFLVTCVYGTLFIVLGNLSGNAIGFGSYVLEAANIQNNDAAIRGLAIAALTTTCLLHAIWRKGGILLNNAFAFMKVMILLLIIIAGLASLGGASLGRGTIHTANFDTHTSFSNPRKDMASYTDSLVYAMYPYTGFLQPFYVLSEVKRPQGIFAKATIGTMIFVVVLYILVNVAFFSVVSKAEIMGTGLDIASRFFEEIFGSTTASRVMAGIIAFSIYGNILVMTFTASRVKQEIAKEGILPFSKFFAGNTTTLVAKLWAKLKSQTAHQHGELEQSPAAALLLHWVFATLLIAFTASQTAAVAYSILVDLYAYVIMLLMKFFVATGLLYLQWRDPVWREKSLNFRPWGGSTAVLLVSLVTGFLLLAAFVPPADDSPYAFSAQKFQWYIIPTVGLGGLFVGGAYFIVFRYIIPQLKGKQLVVERVPIIVSDDYGGWVQKHEIVEFSWGIPELMSDDEK
ncbi:hypothetical protein MMC13_000971 [Lambiella insularis]|nr:hypothetical protein [Lambiella insularis]